LNLISSIYHVKSLPSIKCKFNDLDIVIVRENTEGEYSGIEHEVTKGVYESIKLSTYDACYNTANFAIKIAQYSGRNKLTIVHKANIMKKADGQFKTATEDA